MLKNKPGPAIPLDLGRRQLHTGPVWFSNLTSSNLPPPSLHSRQDVLSSLTLPRTLTQSISFLLSRNLLFSAQPQSLPFEALGKPPVLPSELSGLQISPQIPLSVPGLDKGFLLSAAMHHHFLYFIVLTGMVWDWLGYLISTSFLYWSENSLRSRTVLVFSGCHNKVPEAGWLKMTEICLLTVLEARSLRSVCRSAGLVSSGVSLLGLQTRPLIEVSLHGPSSGCMPPWYKYLFVYPNFLFV